MLLEERSIQKVHYFQPMELFVYENLSYTFSISSLNPFFKKFTILNHDVRKLNELKNKMN